LRDDIQVVACRQRRMRCSDAITIGRTAALTRAQTEFDAHTAEPVDGRGVFERGGSCQALLDRGIACWRYPPIPSPINVWTD